MPGTSCNCSTPTGRTVRTKARACLASSGSFVEGGAGVYAGEVRARTDTGVRGSPVRFGTDPAALKSKAPDHHKAIMEARVHARHDRRGTGPWRMMTGPGYQREGEAGEVAPRPATLGPALHLLRGVHGVSGLAADRETGAARMPRTAVAQRDAGPTDSPPPGICDFAGTSSGDPGMTGMRALRGVSSSNRPLRSGSTAQQPGQAAGTGEFWSGGPADHGGLPVLLAVPCHDPRRRAHASRWAQALCATSAVTGPWRPRSLAEQGAGVPEKEEAVPNVGRGSSCPATALTASGQAMTSSALCSTGRRTRGNVGSHHQVRGTRWGSRGHRRRARGDVYDPGGEGQHRLAVRRCRGPCARAREVAGGWPPRRARGCRSRLGRPRRAGRPRRVDFDSPSRCDAGGKRGHRAARRVRELQRRGCVQHPDDRRGKVR